MVTLCICLHQYSPLLNEIKHLEALPRKNKKHKLVKYLANHLNVTEKYLGCPTTDCRTVNVPNTPFSVSSQIKADRWAVAGKL